MILSQKQRLFIGIFLMAWILFPAISVFADTAEYFYDLMDRLVRADYDNGMTIKYVYDKAGNRTQKIAGANIPPDAAFLVSPSWCSDSTTPVFTWEEGPGATLYKLRVERESDGFKVIDQWYTAAEANCTGTTCSLSSPQSLSDTTSYTWRVRTQNGAGLGPWSANLDFMVNAGYCPTEPTAVPGAATLVCPSWCTSTSTPTLTWAETANASEYKVELIRSDETPVLKQWYQWWEVDCNGSTCSVTAPALSEDSYTWRVRTWSTYGFGPWSASEEFRVNVGYCAPQPTAVPGAATLTSPSWCTSTSTPTLTWAETANASEYKVELIRSDETPVLKQWYQWWEVDCNGSTCSVTAPALSEDSYTWRVRTWSTYGFGPWSASEEFRVNVGYCAPQPTAVPGAATLSSPSGCITDPTPTLTWAETANASEYKVHVIRSDETPVLKQWYEWWEVDCNGSSCSVTAPALSEDSYTWQVRTWSGYGFGPWSTSLGFEVAASCPESLGAEPAGVTFRKAGSGSGTILVGAQECGPGCDELQVPYADYALLTVIAAEGSHFVRLEREDGAPLNVDSFEVSPGETVVVIFEQNE